jgi:hypothetical protein
LTIDVSMIAMIMPNITVAVTSTTGGSGRACRPVGAAAAEARGRSGAREAMTDAPGGVLQQVRLK